MSRTGSAPWYGSAPLFLSGIFVLITILTMIPTAAVARFGLVSNPRDRDDHKRKIHGFGGWEGTWYTSDDLDTSYSMHIGTVLVASVCLHSALIEYHVPAQHVRVQLFAIAMLALPSIFTLSVDGVLTSIDLQLAVFRSRTQVRLWFIFFLLHSFYRKHWRYRQMVTLICAYMLYTLPQISPERFGSNRGFICIIVVGAIFFYVQKLCIQCLLQMWGSSSEKFEARSKARADQLQFLTTTFSIVLSLSMIYTFALELAFSFTTGEFSITPEYVWIHLTFECVYVGVVCAALGRSIFRGWSKAEADTNSRKSLLYHFDYLLRGQLVNAKDMLTLLKGSLPQSTIQDKDDLNDAFEIGLNACLNMFAVLQDKQTCDELESSDVVMHEKDTLLLPFIHNIFQIASKRNPGTRTQSKVPSAESQSQDNFSVLGGELAEIDFAGVIVKIDEKLSTAIRSIVSNALAVSSQDNVILTLRKIHSGPGEPELGNNAGLERVRIEIYDHRPNPEQHKYTEAGLFESSAHFSSSTETETGLGLWIAFRTVGLTTGGKRGYEIWTRDGTPAGLCVYIELPAKFDPEFRPPETPPPVLRPIVHTLIVDDSMPTRKAFQRLLEQNHISQDYEQVADGIDAVNLLQERGVNYFDLIFLDNLMLKLHGPEAARRMREMGCRSIIIGATSLTTAQDRDTFLANGADDVLYKPVDVALLIQVVDNHRTIRPRRLR